MKNIIWPFLVFSLWLGLISCSASNSTEPERRAGVTIYYRTNFDQDQGGFYGSKQVRQTLVEEAISGKALKTICRQKWSGPALKIKIEGSQGLKIAFMAKGLGFKLARLNLFDKLANDNTTPYAYRFLPEASWTPVLYYVDRFHYNSRARGYVRPQTFFTNLRFWSPDPKGREVAIILDNFIIYRGEDSVPPEKVKGLRAQAGPEGIRLSWEPPEDNVFPMVYVVSRAEEGQDFIKIAETYRPFFLDRTAGKKVYHYRVLAVDFQNNLGPWSSSLQVEGKAEPRLRPLTREEKDRLLYADHLREVHQRGKGRVNKALVCLFGDSLAGPTLYPRLVEGALGIYKVKAYGFAGQTTGFGRRKVAEILAKERPEFLFVMFGTNNVRGRLRTVDVYERWMDDLEAIVKEAESQGVVVALATIPPRGFKDPLSLPEAMFNEALVKRARRLKVPVAYVFEMIQASGPRQEFIWKDGVHWTPRGMEVAALAWAKTMDQIEFVLRDRP